jgi:23S rRNA (adenine2503-C2)-methyltransferase
VGCRFHCAFCASGQTGFARNLAAGEMVAQVLVAARALGDPPTHIVFMGIGEPLDNYDAVLKTVRIINNGDGLKIGARRITISTCGIVPGIRRLAGEGLQVELSVSLHAPVDKLRSRLMPVNRRYPLADLIPACKDYSAATKRIVTFEYVLIRELNDSPERAAELAELLAPLPCRVNLIPLSPVKEFEGDPPSTDAGRIFMDTLARAGINATLRNSRGCSIDAACGQLRTGTMNRDPGVTAHEGFQ